MLPATTVGFRKDNTSFIHSTLYLGLLDGPNCLTEPSGFSFLKRKGSWTAFGSHLRRDRVKKNTTVAISGLGSEGFFGAGGGGGGGESVERETALDVFVELC